MQKTILLLVTVCFALGMLAGCSSKPDAGDAGKEPAKGTAQPAPSAGTAGTPTVGK
jgi:outer membrane murein-binding lipoprotein Lpp